MKDRFKFRCWDKENNCLHYPTRYSNFNIVNGVIVKIESYLTRNGVYRGKGVAYEFDDAILMQCTGLKDKNGKLIYEGDIVKDDHEANHQAVWCYNGFALKPLWEDGYTKGIVDDEIEVIGNIYENSELLED